MAHALTRTATQHYQLAHTACRAALHGLRTREAVQRYRVKRSKPRNSHTTCWLTLHASSATCTVPPRWAHRRAGQTFCLHRVTAALQVGAPPFIELLTRTAVVSLSIRARAGSGRADSSRPNSDILGHFTIPTAIHASSMSAITTSSILNTTHSSARHCHTQPTFVIQPTHSRATLSYYRAHFLLESSLFNVADIGTSAAGFHQHELSGCSLVVLLNECSCCVAALVDR